MSLSDIEIAQEAKLEAIEKIAYKLEIEDEYIEKYGKFKAKIDYKLLEKRKDSKDGKLILVTAISPTPAGEGKTTTTVGLGDALEKLNKKCVIALREPSLGPVFGIKGGAAGGGYAQIVPMEEINLHFTGDIHAISAANNLLAALLDNHIHHGNELQIDTRNITWKRVVDMNDRQLRYIVDGLNGRANGMPREDSFNITVASEIMAILCLASDLIDLKRRLAKIVVAYNLNDQPVTAKDLRAEGALAALLIDALKPNLVQTLEKTPAFIHGGPFANIAHGCNSIMATKMALKLGDYVVTEAGFGADLGAEKFLNIKCRIGNLKPDAVVIVATIRALKHHGGVSQEELELENMDALKRGFPNLERHLENISKTYNLPAVVAINFFPTDLESELNFIKERCKELGVNTVVSNVWAKGSEGGLELAEEVIRLSEQESNFEYTYPLNLGIKEKINSIVTKIYKGRRVNYSKAAEREIDHLEELNFGNLPICMAKTQYSFTDNAKKLGAPDDFDINITQVRVSAGAGFLVVLTGDVMTMPGLPKHPSSEKIDIDNDGKILGLS